MAVTRVFAAKAAADFANGESVLNWLLAAGAPGPVEVR